MRRAPVIAALSALALALPAVAETWTPYTEPTDTGLQWSYDADYSYRDAGSGRIVVMTAIGKVGATPRMGPSAPGAADGVGFVYALDCNAKNLIPMGGYSPRKPLEIASNWRGVAPKKADGADDAALMRQVCAASASLPTR
ncbi:MAG: hypothetical protein LW830_04945 [Phenylobacterium sp.]|jgi:hypothetical protein|nr:hypothetical protein [Phenylobacterium sp.]